MKKSILAIAVASLAASSAAIAEPTVYGNLHISLNAADNDVDGADNNLKVSSNTSAIGVKGSEDLGNGLKAIMRSAVPAQDLSRLCRLPGLGFWA